MEQCQNTHQLVNKQLLRSTDSDFESTWKPMTKDKLTVDYGSEVYLKDTKGEVESIKSN